MRKKKKRKDLVKSLYARMLATYLAVTLGALVLIGVTVGALFRVTTIKEKKAEINRELAVISQLYANARTGLTAENVTKAELSVIARHYGGLIQIIDGDGAVAEYSSGAKWIPTAQQPYTPDMVQQMLQKAGKTNTALFEERANGFPRLTGTIAVTVDGDSAHVIRFHEDLTAMAETLGTILLEVVMVGMLTVLVAAVMVYATTARITQPFLEINDIVQKYSKGDYNIRIPTSNTQEASQLAMSFNNMADQLKDLEATRRSFVANVSHELRSPLTSMRGFLEAMQDGTIGEEDYPKYIEIVLSETRRMTNMVNDLLDLARIESGKTAVNLEFFDINELIRRTLLTFEARIYEKAMEVEIKFAQSVFMVEADSAQISQVLRNIIDNAIKYSPDHTRLRIATYTMRGKVYVSIQDSGPGIPEEDIPHVFDRFYKVEKAHTRTNESGTGLGLSIVKRIMDQHGQDITLTSTRGKGSNFTFTLKRAPSPKRTAQDGGKKNG